MKVTITIHDITLFETNATLAWSRLTAGPYYISVNVYYEVMTSIGRSMNTYCMQMG